LKPAARAPNPSRRTPRDFGRDLSLDVAKGFGIILVVLGHCLDGLNASHYFPTSVQWPTLAVYVIYLFHMPLFFVVSGHLASGKHRPAGTTFARLLPTIVYPYILWSILEGLVLVYLSRYTTSHVPLSSLYKILWIPIVPYWFLYALFFCHVGYLVIRNLSHQAQFLIALAVFAASLLFLDTITHFQLLIVQETVHGFLFFVLGVISVKQVKQLGGWAAITATVLFIVFAVALYQSHLGGVIGSVAVVPVTIAGITATLAWSRLVAAPEDYHPAKHPAANRSLGKTLVGALAFFGRYSMSIYVMHIFFTAGVRIALKRLAATPTVLVTILEIVAATVLGTLVPLGINWLVSRFELDRWFGLQHMEAR
jgi:fucose 4-O-acetylase-like acetyltransferase